MFRTVLVALVSLTATAQTTQVDPSQLKRPFKTGTVLPSQCTTGDMFFKTDASAGSNVYGCAATNQWAVQGNGAATGGNLTVESDGVAVGARGMENFVTGVGLTTLVTDTGTQINVQTGLDTAVVQTRQGEQSGTALLCSSATGSTTNYQCSLNPTAAAYTTGMVLHWRPDVSGAGGATTLNIDTLGATPIKLADGITDPAATDIVAGCLYIIWYDGAVFRVVSSGTGGGVTTGTGSTNSGPALSTNMTLDLGPLAFNYNTSTCIPNGWNLIGTSAAGTLYVPGWGYPCYLQFASSGSQGAQRFFRWPGNFDNTKAVGFILSAADPSGGTGSIQFTVSIACLGAGVSTMTPPTLGTPLPTGPFTITAGTLQEISVSGVSVSAGACDVNSWAWLQLQRDSTVSGNSPDAVGVLDLALTYSVK